MAQVAPTLDEPGPGGDLPVRVGSSGRRWSTRELIIGLGFLLPAAILLVAIVVYPIGYTIVRSLFDRSGDEFVGLDNYREMFSRDSTRTAIKNNIIWVLVAPTVITAIGLVFAVMIERVRFSTAFKVAIFMPMAISFLAAGVIFRLVYEHNPDQGVANAIATGIADIFRPAGDYLGARPSDAESLLPDGNGFRTAEPVAVGDVATLGLVALSNDQVPDDAEVATPPQPVADGIAGVVWRDFTVGGGGESGVVDPTEQGLPGIKVEAIDADGDVVGSATTDGTGAFTIEGLEPGEYRLRLGGDEFRSAFDGFEWLGPRLVTWSIIAAFVWIWAGFAMVVIAAGLAAIPRETLEAARVDGANEWQVFRKVTVPLLAPVLLVVAVTLMINVLKVFDLVFIIPPQSTQDEANVVALELWRVSFGGGRDEGLGSALGVLLFVLVVPGMLFNLRRFRLEER